MIVDIALGTACLCLLGASAFFSGSETALFALDPRERHMLRKRQDRRARRVGALLAHLDQVLVTLLVGNTFVNILFATLATRLFIGYLGEERGIIVSGISVTALILVFGEILPKSIAVRHSLRLALRIARPLSAIKSWLDPVAGRLRGLSHGIVSLLDRVVPGDSLAMQEEDMLALISLAVEEGSIDRKERELVQGVFELGDTPVGEIMTPRVDLFLLDARTPAREAALRFREAGYSRAPVWRDSPERVVAVLEVSALLDREEEETPVGELATPARFCPESQRAGSLLLQLLREGAHQAVVLDEYGSLAGLAALEDLYEILVGEILGRRDFAGQRYYMPDEKTLIASSRMEIERAEQILDRKLPRERAETLGGAMMEWLGEVPEPGRRYEHGGLAWTVVSAEGPILGTVKLEKLP